MGKKPDDLSEYRHAYLRAEPGQLTTQRQMESWRQFLKDFVLCLCGNDPVALIFHDAFGDSLASIPGSHVLTTQNRGAKYRIYELPEITAEIFNEHFVGANEFRQNIDLFIWKPRALICDSQIRQIIDWRDSMFDQTVPFSEIIATNERIGFPAEDGECFYWANPDVSLTHLESMAKASEVNLTQFNWGATGGKAP